MSSLPVEVLSRRQTAGQALCPGLELSSAAWLELDTPLSQGFTQYLTSLTPLAD